MTTTPLALGLLAGVTIFLGLPIAVLPWITTKMRAFLTAASTGVLLFLMVEMMGKVLEGIEELLESASVGYQTSRDAWQHAGLFVVGLSVGLLGLVWFERRFIRGGKDAAPPKTRAHQVALMIAIGIGLHNFSEGLAIGHEHSFGATRLALLLAVGFGLHNATEGFGIAAPLAGHTPRWGFLALLGLIGGGPTFLGAIVGSLWTSQALEVFFLSLAAGTILYLVGELLHLGRQMREEATAEIGLLVGFFVAMATDFLTIIFS
ncbi:MAG: ZIP family metal transporter [Candidatus Omnitrophica bacterium]|nr:ZIP family metal transporter [Candidatus Omnitrophota bacterium]